MNKKSILSLAIFAALTVFMIGCGTKKSTETNAVETKQVESSKAEASVQKKEVTPPKEIVCVWDGVPVRETPVKNGKYLSSINLGETITDLNETQIDASDKNREYLKVRLSDGKEGWAPNYGLIKNASVGVIKSDAQICKRPDLLTITDIVLKPMELVAITNIKDEWAEITNEQKKKNGWIKKDALTTSKEDITTSILINKKLAAKDGKSMADKYKTIIAETPFPNSIFIAEVKKQLEALEIASVPAVASEPESPSNSGSEATNSTETSE